MVQTELDILRDITNRLNAAGIAFMLTGSVAMNHYAQPRMTRDVDLVVALKPGDDEKIIALFEPDYYVPRDAVAQAIARRGMFNLIHNDSIIKVDCVVLKDEPYRLEEFARRQEVTIGGFQTWIVSREDLILSKLYWARDSRSEMQLRDVRNLLVPECDLDYLQSRAQELGVADLLKEVLTAHE
jgi:hypothetical protein